MGELSIKVKIGDREYPMRIDAAEEEKLRLAGRILNEKMKNYRDQFGINDKQDLLAMVAFECLSEKLNNDAVYQASNSVISSKISEMEELMASATL
jgi:cell division protein ZapA